MSLITFPVERRTTPQTDEATCSCGGVWFRPLRARTNGEDLPGGVLLRPDGSVRGYTGTMRCVDCGNDFKP